MKTASRKFDLAKNFNDVFLSQRSMKSMSRLSQCKYRNINVAIDQTSTIIQQFQNDSKIDGVGALRAYSLSTCQLQHFEEQKPFYSKPASRKFYLPTKSLDHISSINLYIDRCYRLGCGVSTKIKRHSSVTFGALSACSILYSRLWLLVKAFSFCNSPHI